MPSSKLLSLIDSPNEPSQSHLRQAPRKCRRHFLDAAALGKEVHNEQHQGEEQYKVNQSARHMEQHEGPNPDEEEEQRQDQQQVTRQVITSGVKLSRPRDVENRGTTPMIDHAMLYAPLGHANGIVRVVGVAR